MSKGLRDSVGNVGHLKSHEEFPELTREGTLHELLLVEETCIYLSQKMSSVFEKCHENLLDG